MKRVLLAAAAALLAAPALGSNETIIGRASVIDADTIEIHGQRIRLFGVDAPEGRQTCQDADGKTYRCGQKSSFALDNFIAQAQPVYCEPLDIDRYNRVVATCSNAEGKDIGAWLVRNGHAVDYTRYSTGTFINPWEFRALHR
ncbi:thermonuclease family protein [Phyllobacterium pellucidum]|uniref:thermonuclease family protein n=1 Tax=Phyllobacterium pellucidum TaxID=2740464 RepID=UPI001FE9CD6D|nr:thermonuclease family protein [Phyllobacterium pellucidum]